MQILLLVRHALAGSNRDGTASCAIPGEGLTAAGLEQAHRLRRQLEAEEIALGVATELRRTQDTLELTLQGRDLPMILVPELNEIDFGCFDGGPIDGYRSWAAAQPPTVRPPGGGESRAVAAARFARGLRLLLERPEAVILAVGHALTIRYVLDAVAGLSPAARMAPVEHALPHRLRADEAAAAARLLSEWSRAPVFRSLPDRA